MSPGGKTYLKPFFEKDDRKPFEGLCYGEGKAPAAPGLCLDPDIVI